LEGNVAKYFDIDAGASEFEFALALDHKLSFLEDKGRSSRRWLVLCDQAILLAYDKARDWPFFWGAHEPRLIEGNYFWDDVFEASSSLTEGSVHYGPDNLGTPRDRLPWVEGAAGHGIGEHIDISLQFPTSRFWVSIGFVSYERPELYELNSRPKRVVVVDRDSGESTEFTLKDSPDLQFLELGFQARRMRITIKEVYPGTRWDDTAINFIMF